MKKLLFLNALIATFLLSGFGATAQNYLGLHASNFNGTLGLSLQPASFVDGRFKYDIYLGGMNFAFWNNAKDFNTDQMPKYWRKSFGSDTAWKTPDSTFYKNHITDIDDYNSPQTGVKGLYTNYQIDIANFAFHINKKSSLGFFARSRMVTNVNDVDPKFLKLIENGLNFSELWNSKLSNKSLSGSTMFWNEYGVNYGQVLSDKKAHFLKGGVSVKVLQGLSSAYAYTDNIDYEVLNSDTATSLRGTFDYGYSDNFDNLPSATHLKKVDVFNSNSKLGIGFDLGFVYEWRPKWQEYQYEMDGVKGIWDQEKNKYKVRIAAAVVDIGGMKFTKGGSSRNFSVDTKSLDLQSFRAATSFQTIDSIIDSLIVANPSEWIENEGKKQTYYMNTPMSVNFQIDYHIWKDIYLNGTMVINTVGKTDRTAVRVPNQFSATLSFEHLFWWWIDVPYLGLHIPFAYNKYSGYRSGMAIRLGPLHFGVQNFKALFATGNVNGAELYAGLRLPIHYENPLDYDKDRVSDKIDVCPEFPGIWDFKGCPDKDSDGVQDSEDTCPDEAGLKEFQGCPDRDGDKIADKDDECPDLAGIVRMKGCPDRDNDNVIDPKDDCPDVAGLEKLNGCPDKDGDGIKDEDDACPEVAGPKENNGCPDTDKDGIFDFLDNCPNTFGPKENNGCPWPDTDKDGLLDKDDECPFLAGPAKNNGCPYKDTDGDGVLDKDDDCPTVKGVVENKGCPKIEAEAIEILKTAFENLEFNSGNAVIKDVSFASLDELAALLIKKPTWNLQIAGHTDNQGDAQKNLVLSKQRAESVKTYLASKGLDVKRFSTLFFGETQPVATNDTPEGRQKNRRVEMTVIFK